MKLPVESVLVNSRRVPERLYAATVMFGSEAPPVDDTRPTMNPERTRRKLMLVTFWGNRHSELRSECNQTDLRSDSSKR